MISTAYCPLIRFSGKMSRSEVKNLILILIVTFAPLLFCKPLNGSLMVFPEQYEEVYKIYNQTQKILLDQIRKKSDSKPDIARASTDKESELSYKPELMYGKFFQGDMVLQPDQEEFMLSKEPQDQSGTRTGILNEAYRWPTDRSGHVKVAYQIQSYVYSES